MKRQGNGAARDDARARGVWGGTSAAAAAAACAAQLPVAGALFWLTTLNDDTYGAGYGGALAAFGLLCAAVFVPLVLPVVGIAHAAVHTLPALSLARVAAARAGGPEWAWRLPALLLPGAAWAGLSAALGGPFVVPLVLVTASGVLPALAVAYWWRRAPVPRDRRIWFRSGLAALLACVTVLCGGLAATGTGLLKEYEPPKLSRAQLTGVWRGDDGEAVLRLRADGRATLTRIPYDDWESEGPLEVARCDATGTWTTGVEADRPAVRLHVGGCGDGDAAWTIGGSEARPELFVLLGDPDSGDLRKLFKA
ncbi:hypothetical protein [Streptomyces sp. NPDC059063]|uniref:hypothetical protein n=1 Tax=unclassified Streptomyces TaxID=2593676 RepID=UPI003676F969